MICPFISWRKQTQMEIACAEEKCALWIKRRYVPYGSCAFLVIAWNSKKGEEQI